MPKLQKPQTRKGRFGELPPAEADTHGNLEAPETAPARRAATTTVDGRALRATGRTVQFATRVHPDWKLRLHRLSEKTSLMYVELLERALDALERELKAS